MGTLSRQFLDTPSGKIAYAAQGDGPVALFVHGVILNADVWKHQLAELSTERRCIAVDLLGHGHSRAAEGADLSFQGLARMLVEFIDALGIEQVDLVANDSGTGIAQLFAVTYPSRLRTLTLTDGDVHDNWPPEPFAGFVQMVADGGLATTLRALADDPDVFRSVNGFGPAFEHPEKVGDDAVHAYLDPLLARPETLADLERFILAFDSAQTVRIKPELEKLRVSTLVVWGTADIFFDKRWAAWLADTIPGVQRSVEFEGAALLFPEERAAEFNDLLRQHWETS
ncbi:alpha/beta fold hydrolase [Pseudonocardia spinosispora]|uniref:alpha/beta fold hydrolase n=1 Tax=Pseudonocardia spinosispora TaxID=103441 RepID=UPI00048F892D|nr:alpha/beta hydrolase [Pseudonocardia spinosispora]